MVPSDPSFIEKARDAARDVEPKEIGRRRRTPFKGLVTSGMEGTAAWRIREGGNFASNGTGRLRVRVNGADGGRSQDECPGIGVLRVSEDLGAVSFFDDLPEVHDGDPGTEVSDDIEVVADQKN